MFTPESGASRKNLCKICQLIENYDADIERNRRMVWAAADIFHHAHVFVKKGFHGLCVYNSKEFMMRQSTLKI